MTLTILLADGSSNAATDLLIQILLGILLGAGGQLLRSIVIWKQAHDVASKTNSTVADNLDVKKLVISFGIGAVAGVCCVLGLIAAGGIDWKDVKTALGIAAAGYAGADFIEGFATRYLPKDNTASSSDGTPAARTPNDDPNAAAATAEKLG